MIKFRRKRSSDFRPTSRRQQLVILLLAVAMAVLVWVLVMDVPGRLERANRPRPDRPPCAPGQLLDCTGGKVDVIMLPPAPAPASASTPATGG